MKKYWWIIFITLILFIFSIICINSLYSYDILKTLGIMFKSLYRGVGYVIFTPWTLIIIAIMLYLKFPDKIQEYLQRLAKIFNNVGPISFREDSDLNLKDANDTIKKMTNSEQKAGTIEFYKQFFNLNLITLMSGQLFYAYYNSFDSKRKTKYIISELFEMCYGEGTLKLAKSPEDILKGYSMIVSLLISVGAIEGTYVIESNNIASIENSRPNENAIKAILELEKEGYNLRPKATAI